MRQRSNVRNHTGNCKKSYKSSKVERIDRNGKVHDIVEKTERSQIDKNAPIRLNKITNRNKTQLKVERAFENNKVLVLLGPAGVGKSFIATYLATQQLANNRCERIILSRPIVAADEELGFLPGDIKEKTDPYMRPLTDCLCELIGFEAYQARYSHSITVTPLAYTRGLTFKNAVCILDEAQNATYKQLKMYLTRFDSKCKIIITGDISQIDNNVNSGLQEIVNKISGVPGVEIINFSSSDCMRDKLAMKFSEIL